MWRTITLNLQEKIEISFPADVGRTSLKPFYVLDTVHIKTRDDKVGNKAEILFPNFSRFASCREIECLHDPKRAHEFTKIRKYLVTSSACLSQRLIP